MRFFCLFIATSCLFSCSETKRDFFQNLKADNTFLDTFSLSNLKGFGLTNNLISKRGKDYYSFNCADNGIYVSGSFRKDEGTIHFLPEDSDTELLFLDSSWKSTSFVDLQSVTTKSKDFYSVTWLGLSFSHTFNDSIYNVKIDCDGVFNHPESLIFQVKRDFELVSIRHVNCKQDTLLIRFLPKEEIYFTHYNPRSKCL
jgi:hypothetical protein